MATKEPQDRDVDSYVKQDDSDSGTTKRKTKVKNEEFNSADTRSPQRLKPVRVYGHPNVTSGDSKSVVEVGNTKMEDTRKSNTAGNDTKTCYFYKDDDYWFPGVKVAINPRKYKKFDTLLHELSRKIPGLGYGVRTVATPGGHDRISNLDGLTHDGSYICSSSRLKVRGLDIGHVAPREVWKSTRPPSGRRIYNNMLREDPNSEPRSLKRAVKPRSNQMYRAYIRNEPKKVTVLKNSDPTQKHLLLLNRRTGQQFEQVLSDLSSMFHFRIQKLYTTDGRRIQSLNQLFKAPDTLVCCGDERFDPMGGRSTSRVMSRVSLHTRGSDVVSRKMRSRRERMANTKGRWKVWVATNGNASASTQAQVTITVYGHKGNSGPISLGSGDGSHFQSGNIDEFEEINIGNVGEIYKIRIAHDNSGDSPGWLCDEIRMKDLDTDEELQFVCHRWLARDQDDGEICRELAAIRKYEPSLSVVRYSVYVTTGNLWNAGTDANVYMTMYGDKGDTGVRQLYSANKSSLFKQGKTDVFTVEAVSLGHLKRIIVGHDGTGPGLGWYLERIVVKEPGSKEHESNVFYCGKWLDEGEDDGKIVRELKLQDEYMDDILEKRNWEHERWKFEKNCQVKLFSLASGKALRGKANGSLDAQGRDLDMSVLFNVGVKKTMVRLFGSVTNPNSYITIDSGKMSINGKGGPFCEFRVRVQDDRSVMLESVKNPLQFLTFGENGHPENVKGILDKEKTRRFFVFCKGMFRHRGVVMFSSSLTQTITINPDMTMTALGKKAKMAHFRVHKVGNGVRMFESIAHPGKYIRMKDGKIDCQGERNEFSHFLVEKRKSGGYVSLQSAKQRGLYLGMKPDGRVWPTVDTGVNNIHLFPEVIEWGAPKLTENDVIEEVEEEPLVSGREQITTQAKMESPSPEPEQTHAEGEWGIEVSTSDDLHDANVTLVAYGNKGNTGAILLGAPPGKEVFLAGNNDQFKANLLKAGKLYKIRLELVPKSKDIDPSWKVKEVVLTNLNTKEVMTFTFNRWLSREHEDAEIMRELPAVWKDEETPPVLKYHVMVYTGEEEESSTDANVYLNIYGEKGDTGKRYLIHSNYSHKFQSGQVDVFEVEAVWLGKLEKCVVGHDSKEPGRGWYLSQIIIRENEDAKEEYIFPGEKWLDSGKSDQSIERTLRVKEPAPILRFYEDQDVRPVVLVTDPIPEEEEEEEGAFKDGDWNVILKTGSEDAMATSNMVFLYAYGSKDSIGPLKLGSGKDGNFLSGKEDKVKVAIGRNLGNLYKVRIGHNEAYPDSGWYLEKLSLQDCVTGDEFSFTVNRWLSRSHDDGDIWREFAIPYGGKSALPVVTYTLTVNTGSESGANTSASVFVCLHGNKGDTGKRKLFKSKDTNNPFQVGAHDTFELEAVSLEGIERITVSHDGKGSDPAWYLESIVITDNYTNQELYFHCDRWLDEKKGDHKCEVDLFPGEQPSESRGEYSVVLRTADDSSPAHGGRVDVCMYGSKGKSEDITLYAPDPTADLFEPGNIDSFVITVGDLGDLYKVRITREDRDDWEAWHLEEVKMQDIDTKRDHMFACNCWLSRNKGDFDIIRELPVASPSKQLPPVYMYEVSVKVGQHWAAETDAVLYVNIIGEKGDSGRRRLFHAIDTKGDKFQRGQMDTFVFEAVSLGELTEVQIGHDSTGHGAGIYIDTVTVMEKNGPAASDKYVFPCNAWLDKREGDGRTWRLLPLMDKIDTKKPSPQRDIKKKTKGHYSVVVKTSDIPEAGTQAQVYITGFGNKGKSKQMPLGSGQVLFDRGTQTEVSVNFGNIGDMIKIRLEHDNKNSFPSWHVDWLKLTDIDTNEELVFYINQWFAIDEGDGQIMREFSVDKPGDMPLPLTQYVVVLTTGKDSDPMASHGLVSLNLIGQFGDTGMRPLNQSILSDSSPWKPGSEDIFIIEAVSVGKVDVIQVQYEGQDTVWCVEKVHVYERLAAISQTVFNCYKAFSTKDQGPVVTEEFKYSAIKPGICPSKVVEKFYGDIAPVLSKGNFSVSVHCGNQSQSETEDDVYMVIHGVKDQSQPIHINKTDKFHRGAVIHHNVETKGLGAIVKLRIFFGGEFTGSGWFLKKIKVKDNDTKEELQFIYNDLLTCTEENPDGSIELPAIRPDIAPLAEDEFTFYVATGNRPEAATEADVFCELIGDWGSSGRRMLTQSKNKVPFKRGQVDEFRFKGLDLGNLKECVISLNDRGRGRGWFCDRILVKSNLDPTLKIFQCNHWMDTGCEDRQLVRHLQMFGIMPVTPPPVTAKSKGRWSCEVVTADKDDLPKLAHDRPPKSREVSLIVYGSNSVKGPIELINTDGMETFLPGHTDHFPIFGKRGQSLDLGDIGAIQKIRVCAGYEQDPNTVWTIHKVILTDDDTGEVLTYDFSQWVGEIAGDIRKELPTIKMGQGYKQVIPYYVEIHTSDEEIDAATYSNIFITLYGLMADTGRRHLAESRSSKIKFQTGKTDVFIVEAVDLGDLEKVVVAKGAGNPWLLDKVIVKPGEFASEEYVFQHNKWIGTKDQQKLELEETLRLTTVQTSFVASKEIKHLPESKGSWKITTETGGLKGGDNPDIVVVFCSEQEESELCPLKSNRDSPFQIGQTDISTVRTASDVGELYKIRLGFMDNSQYKGWLLRKITCEDEDTGDVFHYELNDWILVDEKNDGWKEIPVAWPAIKVPAVMKYQVIVYTGDVHSAGTDANVYIALFGTKGSTGRRLLKHSLTNNSKFEQDQVDQFEVEAVDLGQLTRVVIGHDQSGHGSGWFLKKVVLTESPESIQKFVFPCDKWLDDGEDDNKIERTLMLDESASDLSVPELQTQASKFPSPIVETRVKTPTPEPKAKTPSPEPKAKIPTPEPKVKTPTPEPKVKTPTPEPKARTPTPEPKAKTPTPEPKAKTPTPEPKAKTPTPELKAKTPRPEPKIKTPTPEPNMKAPTPEPLEEASKQETESAMPSQVQNEDSEKEVDTARTDASKDKSPSPPAPQDGDYKVYVIASNQEDGRGTESQLILTVYGDLGNSGPISLGEPNKGFFKAGVTDLFDIHIDKEELGEIRKIRLEVENTDPNVSLRIEKVEMEDKVKGQRYIFNVNRPLSLEEGDLAVEIPVDDRTHEVWPVRRYVVETYTSTDADAGTNALAHIVLVGTLGDSGRRYLVKNREGGSKFQAGAIDSFIVEAVDLGRLETIIIGHNGKGAESGWTLDKVAIKESVDSKEKYLFPCGSRLQDDDDYGIVEVELYMDRVEQEKSNVENANNSAKEDAVENADNEEDTKAEEQVIEGRLEADNTGEDTKRSKDDQDRTDDRDGEDKKEEDIQQPVQEDMKEDKTGTNTEDKGDNIEDGNKKEEKGDNNEEDQVDNVNSEKGVTYRKENEGQQSNTEDTKTENEGEKKDGE